MAGEIKHKYSNTTTNIPASLVDGEIAINQVDKKLFYKSGSSVLSKSLVDDVTEGSGTYSGTIVWATGTAPSGTTTHSYEWTKVGKMVTMRINLKYSVAGASNNQVSLTLPSGAPTPHVVPGFDTASVSMIRATASLSSVATAGATTAVFNAYLSNNSAATGYQLNLYSSAVVGTIAVWFLVTYWTD